MPQITIEQPHALTADQARVQAERLCATLAEKYGIESRRTSDREARPSRTGLAGRIQIEARRILVRLDLSWTLSPLKGSLERALRRELEALFGAQVASADGQET